MRFGLVGTGHWARETHAAALAGVADIDFVGVWGRDRAKTADLAGHAGVRPFSAADELFDAVDAVVFSVPPDVQAPLATRAAEMGRHLLLEKPIALSSGEATALVQAVRSAGVASVVFFTSLFTPEGKAWLSAQAGRDWEGGTSRWLGNAFAEGSPFDTPWRRDKGGLWDVGPHTLATLTAALGPITAVQAAAGVRDLVHLLLQHEGGATSTASVTLTAPASATDVSVELWGPFGWARMPTGPREPVGAARTALGELMAAAADAAQGRPPKHPYDAEFGRYVVALLEEAQRQVDAAGSVDAVRGGRSGA